MTARIKPRTAVVPIYQGDDLAELSDLNRQVVAAQVRLDRARADRLAVKDGGAMRAGDELPDVAAAQQALDDAQAAYSAFVDEAAPRAVMVELRAIGRRRFAELVAEHPARQVERDGEMVDHDDDVLGVDSRTFPRALLTYADERVSTIVEPTFEDARDRDDFLDDDLSDGDFEKLWTTAYQLNRAVGADPKASPLYAGSPN